MTLMEAAKTGDLEAVARVLQDGGDPNESDESGCPVLVWAVESGQIDVVKLLLDGGATLDAADDRGRTALSVAQAKRDDSTVALLDECQRERQAVKLAALPELCKGVGETDEMCEHILTRLQSAREQLGEAGGVPADTAFVQVVNKFHALLSQHAKKTTLERLVSARTLVGLLRGLHCDIDALLDQVAPNGPASRKRSWQAQWEEDRRSVEERLIKAADSGAEQDEIPNPTQQLEVLMALVYETVEHKKQYSEQMQRVLESAMKRVIRLSRLGVPKLPNWFIPDYEVQRQSTPFCKGSFGKVYRGTWLESQVVIKCVDVVTDGDKRTFEREARIWHKARHRHIVNFFGACHQSNPCFFVCEEAANGNLKDYLYRRKKEKGQSLAWRKMYEAALGLHFLHQRNIIHSDLKCNQILVSKEGVAMLTDFGLSFMCVDSRPKMHERGAVRWKAPEILRDAELAPTVQSDLFSLGMCIVEAVSGEHPWGNMLDAAVLFHVKRGMFLPRPQEFEREDQWQLVRALCASDPAKRLPLSEALRQMKKFAQEEKEQELMWGIRSCSP